MASEQFSRNQLNAKPEPRFSKNAPKSGGLPDSCAEPEFGCFRDLLGHRLGLKFFDGQDLTGSLSIVLLAASLL
jgi:hypothetical protein